MPAPRRFTRIAKWTGTILSLLILATWLITVPAFTKKQLEIFYTAPAFDLVLVDGTIQFRRSYAPWNGGKAFYVTWSECIGYTLEDRVPFGLGLPKSRRFARLSTGLTLPLWIPLALAAIPTLALWRRDRRPGPGHCPTCHYNLTGNTSGVCPECGTAIPNRTEAA